MIVLPRSITSPSVAPSRGTGAVVARLANRREYPCGLDTAQAHVRATRGCHGPRVRPAIAMKHRQRPQVNAVGGQAKRERIAERIQIGATMVIDDALRIARRPRR